LAQWQKDECSYSLYLCGGPVIMGSQILSPQLQVAFPPLISFTGMWLHPDKHTGKLGTTRKKGFVAAVIM
jgi:hypothetical protein